MIPFTTRKFLYTLEKKLFIKLIIKTDLIVKHYTFQKNRDTSLQSIVASYILIKGLKNIIIIIIIIFGHTAWLVGS